MSRRAREPTPEGSQRCATECVYIEMRSFPVIIVHAGRLRPVPGRVAWIMAFRGSSTHGYHLRSLRDRKSVYRLRFLRDWCADNCWFLTGNRSQTVAGGKRSAAPGSRARRSYRPWKGRRVSEMHRFLGRQPAYVLGLPRPACRELGKVPINREAHRVCSTPIG